MRKFVLPIGYFSEEAEKNLKIKYLKLLGAYSRTCSRKSNNEDLMYYLLILSDPIISTKRLRKDKIIRQLSIEAKNLIKWTESNNINNNDNISGDSDNTNNTSEDSDIEDYFKKL